MNKNKGFTLIELLVVISIIGILTGLLTSNLTASQARGRDGKRKTDLKAIATALEIYYSDNGTYPAPRQAATCSNGTLGMGSTSTSCGLLESTGTNTYMKQIPQDPKNTATGNFEYYYCTTTTTPTTASPNRRFNLFANLENARDLDMYCGRGPSGAWGSGNCTVTTTACSYGSAGTSTFSSANVDFTVSEP
jgi:type II secretion system protein G